MSKLSETSSRKAKNANTNAKKSGSKFYPRTLTLLIQILAQIEQGKYQADIARILGVNKSLVNYYVKKAIEQGYLSEEISDRVKILRLTQPGTNFLAQYLKRRNDMVSPLRLENIRFKAIILELPAIPLDWQNVQMKNWAQFLTEVDNVKVKLNKGREPTIEFLPAPIDGDNPYHMYANAMIACEKVAAKLERQLGMKVGDIEPSSRPEWVVYDPIARAFSRNNGQIDYQGFAMVNASKPRSRGEFEFHDIRDLYDYLKMPEILRKVNETIEQMSRPRATHWRHFHPYFSENN